MVNPEKIIEEIKKNNIKKDREKKFIKNEELKPSFFEKNNFLKGLSYNIRSLGYINKKELYEEMRIILNVFQPPELPCNSIDILTD